MSLPLPQPGAEPEKPVIAELTGAHRQEIVLRSTPKLHGWLARSGRIGARMPRIGRTAPNLFSGVPVEPGAGAGRMPS